MACAFTLFVLLTAPVHAEDAVGRLNLAGYRHREMCTASLVAPDLALTAAHCVTTAEDGYLKRLEDMVFVAGWNGGEHAGSARVAEVMVHPGAFDAGRFDLAHDVALVRLDRPLDLAPLPLAAGEAGGPLVLMGYRRSRPHRLTVTPGCRGAGGTIWTIHCGVEQGQSGGPVMAGTGTDRRIVAVIAAVRETETLAVPVDPWLLQQAGAGR